jgi:hypothetical protein
MPLCLNKACQTKAHKIDYLNFWMENLYRDDTEFTVLG